MAKKIEWLDNFAEKYSKEIKKTASKKEAGKIIVDKNVVKNSKIGDLVKFKEKLYKVADLDFVDEVGPGVILEEVGPNVPTSDPMSMSMGTQVNGLENQCVVEPERARTNPGDIYDIGDVRQQEVDAAEQAAQRTVNDISNENMVDRTNIPGHYTAPKSSTPECCGDPGCDHVEDGLNALPTDSVEELPVEEPTEAPVEDSVEELPVEEPTELPAEDSVEELPVEESTEEEEMLPIVGRSNRILRRIIANRK